MTTRLSAPIAAAVALVLVLAGCATGSATDPGSGGSGSSGSTGSSSDGGSDGGASGATGEDCLADRVWDLNNDDLAAQLGAHLTSNGLTVTESSASGSQTVEFRSDGTASATVDATYTITVDSGDGIVISVVQTHSGTPSGNWELLPGSNTLTFTNWDSANYSIQNAFLINGVAGDFPINIPSDTLGGTDMQIVCEGNMLSTKVAISPFTQHWIAEG